MSKETHPDDTLCPWGENEIILSEPPTSIPFEINGDYNPMTILVDWDKRTLVFEIHNDDGTERRSIYQEDCIVVEPRLSPLEIAEQLFPPKIDAPCKSPMDDMHRQIEEDNRLRKLWHQANAKRQHERKKNND